MEKLIFNFFNKSKGVISVFLVIILVPIVTCCCLFVDASRVKLAHSVVESAGDLALNSVLSYFDSDLAEIYGFMASAQNTDEAINNAKDYFKRAMVSQGLDDTTANYYSDALTKVLKGSEDYEVVNDLLEISVDDKNLDIKAATNGSLTNPEIVREQIVEFMKYRAPIEAVSELWDNFSKIKSTTEDSKELTKETDDSNDFYNAENEFLKYMVGAYSDIINFNDEQDSNKNNEVPNLTPGINKTYINNLEKKLKGTGDSGYEKKYENIHKEYAEKISGYIAVGATKYTKYTDKVKIKLINPSESDKKTTCDEFNDLLGTVQSKDGMYPGTGMYKMLQNLIEAEKSLETLLSKLPDFNKGTTNKYVYLFQCQKLLIDNNPIVTNYINAYKAVKKQMNEIYAAYKNLEDSDIAQITDAFPVIINNEVQIQSYDWTKVKEYCEYINSIEINKNFKDVDNRLYGLSNDGGCFQEAQNSYNNCNEKIIEISNELKNYRDALEKALKYLRCGDDCKKKGENKVYDCASNNLAEAVSCYDNMQSKYKTWETDHGNAAYNGTEAKSAADENFKAATEDMNSIGKGNVTAFETRVDAAASLLQKAIDAINSIKYNGKSICDITNITEFDSASNVVFSNVPTEQSDFNTYISKGGAGEFKFANSVASGKISLAVNDANNPDFSVGASKAAYEWVQNKCVDKNNKKIDPRNTDKEDDEDKKNYDKIKKNADDDKKETKKGNGGSEKEISESSGLPSKKNKADVDKEKKISKKISNVANSVTSLFQNFGDSMADKRDDLYVLYYISEMFSYDTFEKEKEYETEKAGSKEDKYAKQTLTNYEISDENNYSYGNEIEYILYGNTNAKNKTTSYATIFALRYAIDLIYAMTNYWNNSTVEGIAIGVQAATYGIVPASLVKLAIILVMTGLEAANDINILKNGHPLQVIKDKDVWAFGFDINALADGKDLDKGGDEDYPYPKEKANADADQKQNGNVCFKYSDYLKLILFMKLIANPTSILCRVADVVQVNMAKMTNSDEYRLDKSIVYWQLTAECKSDSLMLTLPVIQDTLESSNVDINSKSWTSFNKYTLTMYRGY